MEVIHKYKLEKGLSSSVVNSIVSDLLQINEDVSPLVANYPIYKQVANSDYLQETYLKKTNTSYIEPISLTTITDVDGQTYPLKYSAVPLKSILLNTLQNQSLVDYLWNEQRNLNNRHPSMIINSQMDSTSANRIAGKLKIELYEDDTQYSPGFFNKSQKYSCVYISLSDIPFHCRTKADDIEIYMLINKKKLNSLNLKNVYYAVYNRLKSEMEDINNQGGLLLINSTGQSFTVQVTISTILGDNLAIYPLLGFRASFNNDSFYCRNCGTRGHSSTENESIQTPSIRRRLITNNQTTNISELGVRKPFVFDGFQNIHRWNISPPDMASFIYLI